jgi:hypothetical protein
MEGGLSRWRVPPCRVSHPIQKISDGLIIIGLGLKGPASDGPRVGCILASDRDHTAVCLIVSHLHEGGDVGVGVEHGLVRLVCSQYRPWRGVWARALCQLVGWHIKSLFVTFIGKDTLLPNQHSPEDTLDPLSIADQILPP